jgi:hypothetical protein
MRPARSPSARSTPTSTRGSSAYTSGLPTRRHWNAVARIISRTEDELLKLHGIERRLYFYQARAEAFDLDPRA